MKYFEVEFIFKGKKEKKLLKAQNKVLALAMAKSKVPGVVVKVTETAAPLEDRFEEFKKQITDTLTKKQINIDNLITSIRQLGVMTNAGISIHDSIKEVSISTEDKYIKQIFTNIDDSLNSGQSFTESVMPYKYEVGDVTIAMIELGESTGNMSEALLKLAQILEEIRDNRQKFKKALRYPITVIIAIAIAFTILMVYVVPQFKSIFDKFKAELPLPTKILLACEHAINNYGWYILAGIILTVATIKFLYRNKPEFKSAWDRYILRVYLIGNIVFYAAMYRFIMIFSELIKAGIPVVDALDTAIMTMDNDYIKTKLSSVRLSVQRGVSLTEALRNTDLYPGMLIQMVHAGEQSGTLDAMLEKVADYFKMKFDEIVDNIASYIEPILIGFIAGMVLLMALGIFLPMWDLASAVKN